VPDRELPGEAVHEVQRDREDDVDADVHQQLDRERTDERSDESCNYSGKRKPDYERQPPSHLPPPAA
jgi:hypothetical protein